MTTAIGRFWAWYERHYLLNVSVATFLFTLQLVHLFWLTVDVVATRLLGEALVSFTGNGRTLIILVDYTEIPAIISVSLVYLNALRERFAWRDVALLVALNVQVFHIFWITDEFVVEQFGATGGHFPIWLAWVAIGIDYLELPVIYDTLRRFVHAVAERSRVPTPRTRR